MELKDFIRTRRLALHKTLEDIAIVTGVSRATVLRWETGAIRSLRQDKLNKLAKALEVTPTMLLQAGEPASELQTEDEMEMAEYLEYLKNRSEMRMLFSVSKDATKQDIMKAVEIIERLKAESGE